MQSTGRIKRLPQSVVDKIAAGEVVISPNAALKELIENALDAGSTKIAVIISNTTVSDNSKFSTFAFTIKDNGCGIEPEDMKIVCERHTTSKISDFKDLSSVETFGFRGEALAALTHVSKVKISTKTKSTNSDIGWFGNYQNSKLLGEVKFCAREQGTTISISDLFYNLPARRSSFRHSVEYVKIIQLLSRYSIERSDVAFTLKKGTRKGFDVQSFGTGKTLESKVSVIGKLYGKDIEAELLKSKIENSELKLKAVFIGTNANFSIKRKEIIVFINGRLIGSSKISRAIDDTYSTLLPKNKHPFTFISLQVPLESVDVNVHPNKKEVYFLNEEAIISFVDKEIFTVLKGASKSRVFDLTQSNVESVFKEEMEPDENPLTTIETKFTTPVKVKPTPNKMIRTSNTNTRIEKFFSPSAQLTPAISPAKVVIKNMAQIENVISEEAVKLKSIAELREEIEEHKSTKLHKFLKELVYVGIVDNNFMTAQYKTGLFMIDYPELLREMFYQSMLINFGRVSRRELVQDLKVGSLLDIFLSSSIAPDTKKATKEETIQKICKLLEEKMEMLAEYFGICFEKKEGTLVLKALPELITNNAVVGSVGVDYCIELSGLPVFIYRLCEAVDWFDEKECFRTIAWEVAEFYSILPRLPENFNSSKKELEVPDQKNVEYLALDVEKKIFVEKVDENGKYFVNLKTKRKSFIRPTGDSIVIGLKDVGVESFKTTNLKNVAVDLAALKEMEKRLSEMLLDKEIVSNKAILLIREGIQANDLPKLNDEDLKEVGFNLGERLKIRDWINEEHKRSFDSEMGLVEGNLDEEFWDSSSFTNLEVKELEEEKDEEKLNEIALEERLVQRIGEVLDSKMKEEEKKQSEMRRKKRLKKLRKLAMKDDEKIEGNISQHHTEISPLDFDFLNDVQIENIKENEFSFLNEETFDLESIDSEELTEKLEREKNLKVQLLEHEAKRLEEEIWLLREKETVDRIEEVTECLRDIIEHVVFKEENL
eukprot:maker-scaffold_6-augustus-gene-11.71-mRNA-1 protein AED:0.34 eAED:0.34 QI:0/0/0/0.5/1/1/2/0/996